MAPLKSLLVLDSSGSSLTRSLSASSKSDLTSFNNSGDLALHCSSNSISLSNNDSSNMCTESPVVKMKKRVKFFEQVRIREIKVLCEYSDEFSKHDEDDDIEHSEVEDYHMDLEPNDLGESSIDAASEKIHHHAVHVSSRMMAHGSPRGGGNIPSRFLPLPTLKTDRWGNPTSPGGTSKPEEPKESNFIDQSPSSPTKHPLSPNIEKNRIGRKQLRSPTFNTPIQTNHGDWNHRTTSPNYLLTPPQRAESNDFLTQTHPATTVTRTFAHSSSNTMIDFAGATHKRGSRQTRRSSAPTIIPLNLAELHHNRPPSLPSRKNSSTSTECSGNDCTDDDTLDDDDIDTLDEETDDDDFDVSEASDRFEATASEPFTLPNDHVRNTKRISGQDRFMATISEPFTLNSPKKPTNNATLFSSTNSPLEDITDHSCEDDVVVPLKRPTSAPSILGYRSAKNRLLGSSMGDRRNTPFGRRHKKSKPQKNKSDDSQEAPANRRSLLQRGLGSLRSLGMSDSLRSLTGKSSKSKSSSSNSATSNNTTTSNGGGSSNSHKNAFSRVRRGRNDLPPVRPMRNPSVRTLDLDG